MNAWVFNVHKQIYCKLFTWVLSYLSGGKNQQYYATHHKCIYYITIRPKQQHTKTKMERNMQNSIAYIHNDK